MLIACRAYMPRLHADCLHHCMQVADRLQILLYALAIISTTVAILYTAEGCEQALGAALGPESEGESRDESRDELMNGTWSGEGEDAVAGEGGSVAGEGGAVAGGNGLGAGVRVIAGERGAVAGMTWCGDSSPSFCPCSQRPSAECMLIASLIRWGLFVILLPILSTAVGALRLRMRPREK